MPKIVIAEDEHDIRELIAFALRFAGFDVVATANGEEACLATQRENPDLVLLDVRMPRMNGYEACRQIKSDEKTRDIPVVFLSAKGQESEIRTGLAVGAEDYILKPFEPARLGERLKEIIGC